MMNRRTSWSVGFTAVALLLGVVGCGSGVNEALYQTASAAGRTALDIFLTELANAMAGAFERTDAADDDAANGDDADDGGDNGNGDGGDVAPDDLTADAANGEMLYAAGCATCHCADGVGGCAANAPGVVGTSLNTLTDYLGDGATHFGQGPLSNQELVDLEAYLESL